MQIRANPWRNGLVQNKCGQGQPPRPHRSWIPASALSPLGDGAWRRNDRFSPATPAALSSEEAPPWPKRVAHSPSCDDNGATAAAASGPCFSLACLSSEEPRSTSKRGRPQRPGNQSRSRAFLICPPAIHPRESPVAAGSAAIIRQAQELSRFAEPTLSHFVAPRNRKNFSPCAETVDDVSSLWKPEENLRRIAGVSEAGARSRNPERMRRICLGHQRSQSFNSLHAVSTTPSKTHAPQDDPQRTTARCRRCASAYQHSDPPSAFGRNSPPLPSAPTYS